MCIFCHILENVELKPRVTHETDEFRTEFSQEKGTPWNYSGMEKNDFIF